MKIVIALCLSWWFSTQVIASSLTIAEQEKQYQDNVGWAQSAQQGITRQADGQLNIADYCDGAECVNQVNEPPQKGLNDSAINNQKSAEFYSNDTAAAIQDNFNKGRPDIRNDPAYQFALIGQDNAYAITHGISNAYVDCDSGTQCVIKDTPKRCYRPTNNNVPCEKTPMFSSFSELASQPCSGTLNGNTCTECRFQEPSNYVHRLHYSRSNTHHLRFHWDGRRVADLRVPTSQTSAKGYYIGAYKRRHDYATTVYAICRDYTVPKRCPAGYSLVGSFCVKNTLSWQSQCSLTQGCELVSQQCLEGPQTRNINGVPTYLDCWKYQLNYQCSSTDTCAALPTDCQTVSTQCSLKLNGVCIEEQLTKSCPEKTCSTTSLQCLDTTFCLDGDCYQGQPTQSAEFDQSAAGLAAISEAAKGLGDPPLIFAGQGMQCTDKAFGFADCCKDSGWGTNLGIAQCSAEEKSLGQAKEQGIAIALGEYCADKVLGVCTRKKKTYCVYGSKLARLIQEQGVKGQLGISLGSPEHPICDPITPEQLQQINFEHIDFSDFYADMHRNTNLPSASEIQQRLQSAYQQ